MTQQPASAWTSAWTDALPHNGPVRIAYDTLAGSAGDPLLLVMGLAVSRFWWPAGLAQAFADQRFAVARYDQRDAGQSTRMPDTGASNPFAAVARKRGAYSAEDMTDDAVAVLDALGWDAGAHLRRLARRDDRAAHRAAPPGPGAQRGVGDGHAQRRVRHRRRPVRALRPAGQAGPDEGPGRAGRRHPALPAVAREIASPAYPFDETAAREWIEREVDSGPRDTKAQSRQVGAPWHGPKLRELDKPVLVLHGDQDPILRVSAARATARAIHGARLVILPGVGHDLPAPLWPDIARLVRENADRAHARSS